MGSTASRSAFVFVPGAFFFLFFFATPVRVISMLVPFQLVQWQFGDFLCGFMGVVRNMVNIKNGV